MAVQRKLLLLTTWLNEPKLDEREDLRATNIRKTLEDNSFYLNWFRYEPNVDPINPGPLLQQLFDDAPKLRALFRNLCTQVSDDDAPVVAFLL